MAKISPVSIKYMVYASFRSEGPLEKPDVIGAIFGQTEGLLGSELEMRELQKEGKIGRIEVELETVDGKTVGEIKLPSALDKSETTLIAAALETIDRIGPTEAQIKVTKIEDVRGSKRDYILERARKLLGELDGKSEFEDITKSVKEGSRADKIQEYGEERLPAGDISGNEIIVVEGRADVVNLLKNRVNNVIGMNGTKLPAEIARLGEEKEITLFIDGDRGGKLIAKNVITNAKIVYVAVAPDGKEVEELAGKEILISLRKRVPVSVFIREIKGINGNEIENHTNHSHESSSSNVESAERPKEAVKEFDGNAKEEIKKLYGRLKGTKSALLLDSSLDVIRKVAPSEVARSVISSRNVVYAVIIDGKATGQMIKSCDEKGVKHLAATNFSGAESSSVNLISL